MQDIIEKSLYADNAVLYGDSVKVITEQFWRFIICLQTFSLQIHELFSNSNELLLSIVKEGKDAGIELQLHPSLGMPSTAPSTAQGEGNTSTVGHNDPHSLPRQNEWKQHAPQQDLSYSNNGVTKVDLLTEPSSPTNGFVG